LSFLHAPPPFTPGTFPVLILLEAKSTRGRSAAERIRSIENSSCLIDNRTRDSPAYSSVPQPTTLPREPKFQRKSSRFIDLRELFNTFLFWDSASCFAYFIKVIRRTDLLLITLIFNTCLNIISKSISLLIGRSEDVHNNCYMQMQDIAFARKIFILVFNFCFSDRLCLKLISFLFCRFVLNSHTFRINCLCFCYHRRRKTRQIHENKKQNLRRKLSRFPTDSSELSLLCSLVSRQVHPLPKAHEQ
jgi:hypothetical protein